MYSTNSETTKEVCKKIGFDFNINFVKTLKRNGKIFVKGTAGKPHEFALLRRACKKHNYIYKYD